jgi:protein-tyrosine kinase
MARVADALKRSGQLRRDRSDESQHVVADFHSEPASQPSKTHPSPFNPVVDLPRTVRPLVHVDEAVIAVRGTSGKLIGDFADAVVEEEYRMLGATLHRLQERSNIRSVLITSALPKEGKTLSAANMAIVLSRSYGRRVLFIDADLRRPSAHTLFAASREPGLSEALLSHGPIAPLQVRPRLWFLPAGAAVKNSEQLLASDEMKTLLGEAGRQFDWVLIDTPPAGILPDARLLLGNVDGAILVLRAEKTPHDICQRAIPGLTENGKLLGAILNRGRARQRRSYYDSYADSNV